MAGGLPGSTNSYSPSYTIRATENAQYICQSLKTSRNSLEGRPTPAWPKKKIRRQVVNHRLRTGPELTAGIYTGPSESRPVAGLMPQLVLSSKPFPVVNLMITTDVENYPGFFRRPFRGPDLMVEFSQAGRTIRHRIPRGVDYPGRSSGAALPRWQHQR